MGSTSEEPTLSDPWLGAGRLFNMLTHKSLTNPEAVLPAIVPTWATDRRDPAQQFMEVSFSVLKGGNCKSAIGQSFKYQLEHLFAYK